MTLLGLDIGGANIKAATADGQAVSVPFELWKTPERLAEKLAEVVKLFPPADHVGVTMTGELCDCFETKAEGVVHIVDACLKVFDDSKLLFWLVEDGFADAATAKALPRKTAASNWHALASYVGTLYPDEDVLLVDIGSTTTDIIPIRKGRPTTRGKTDEDRLVSRELVYMGIGRTPMAMIVSTKDSFCREFFATSLDAFIHLGMVEEQPENRMTADGRPATKHFAANRIARMIGGDRTTVDPEEITKASEVVPFIMKVTIGDAIEDSLRCDFESCDAIILSGAGEFFARYTIRWFIDQNKMPYVPLRSLSERLGPQISEAAPAYAVAQLLKKHLNQ